MVWAALLRLIVCGYLLGWRLAISSGALLNQRVVCVRVSGGEVMVVLGLIREVVGDT